MKHYGPVVGFVLDGEAQAERFLTACRLVSTATSFGGIHTTAERRARWKGDAIPDGFIRLSAGCEDVQDLLEDRSVVTRPSWFIYASVVWGQGR